MRTRRRTVPSIPRTPPTTHETKTTPNTHRRDHHHKQPTKPAETTTPISLRSTRHGFTDNYLESPTDEKIQKKNRTIVRSFHQSHQSPVIPIYLISCSERPNTPTSSPPPPLRATARSSAAACPSWKKLKTGSDTALLCAPPVSPASGVHVKT